MTQSLLLSFVQIFFSCYSALIECHVDAGRKEDATQISIATLAFTKSNVPSLYTTVLGLQVGFINFDLKHIYKQLFRKTSSITRKEKHIKMTRFLYSWRFEVILTPLSKHIYLSSFKNYFHVQTSLLPFLTQGYFVVQGPAVRKPIN